MTLKDEDKLDEALDETFPASDAPANTIETGIRIGPGDAMTSTPVVRDRPDASRFETIVDGHVAYLEYERRPKAIVLAHTEVPDALRGKGVGNALARFALASARANGLSIIVRCPFVRAYLQKHPAAGS